MRLQHLEVAAFHEPGENCSLSTCETLMHMHQSFARITDAMRDRKVKLPHEPLLRLTRNVGCGFSQEREQVVTLEGRRPRRKNNMQSLRLGQNVKRIVLTVFFPSGISGLIYEVLWARLLRLVFGDTVFAVSTVLAAFMAGLALGSWLLGRFIDRRPDVGLRCYAVLEIAISIYALLVPVFLQWLEPVCVWVIEHYRATPSS